MIRFEDRNPEKMKKIFDKHIEDCSGDIDSPGSILAGVCRARISEGIDFKDD